MLKHSHIIGRKNRDASVETWKEILDDQSFPAQFVNFNEGKIISFQAGGAEPFNIDEITLESIHFQQLDYQFDYLNYFRDTAWMDFNLFSLSQWGLFSMESFKNSSTKNAVFMFPLNSMKFIDLVENGKLTDSGISFSIDEKQDLKTLKDKVKVYIYNQSVQKIKELSSDTEWPFFKLFSRASYGDTIVTIEFDQYLSEYPYVYLEVEIPTASKVKEIKQDGEVIQYPDETRSFLVEKTSQIIIRTKEMVEFDLEENMFSQYIKVKDFKYCQFKNVGTKKSFYTKPIDLSTFKIESLKVLLSGIETYNIQVRHFDTSNAEWSEWTSLKENFFHLYVQESIFSSSLIIPNSKNMEGFGNAALSFADTSLSVGDNTKTYWLDPKRLILLKQKKSIFNESLGRWTDGVSVFKNGIKSFLYLNEELSFILKDNQGILLNESPVSKNLNLSKGLHELYIKDPERFYNVDIEDGQNPYYLIFGHPLYQDKYPGLENVFKNKLLYVDFFDFYNFPSEDKYSLILGDGSVKIFLVSETQDLNRSYLSIYGSKMRKIPISLFQLKVEVPDSYSGIITSCILEGQ